MDEENSQPAIEDSNSPKVTKDMVVSFHYRMYALLENGEKGNCLEDSFDGEAIYYLHGFNNIIRGIEEALGGKSAGATIAIDLDPLSAYGPLKEGMTQRVPLKHLQFDKKPKKIMPGLIVGVQTDKGMRRGVVLKAGKFNADIDFNHPLAGKSLHYEIQINSVRPATAEEIAHRHVHGPGGHQH